MGFECLDETRIIEASSHECCRNTNSPERAKSALLELSISVRMLTCLDDSLLSLLDRGASHATIAFGESFQFLGSSVPMNTSFNAHGEK